MKKVMIVDDELDILYGLQMMLDWESMGFQITAMCMDGYEALEMCEQNVPDIIVTDIRMSGMDGLSLGQKIRECYPRTRLIILTSYSEYSYLQKAIDLRVAAYLLKPVDEEKLKEALLKAASEIDAQEAVAQRLDDLASYRARSTGAVLFSAYAKLLSGEQTLWEAEQEAVQESIREGKTYIMIAREDASPHFAQTGDAETEAFFYKSLTIAVRNRSNLLYSEYRDGQAMFVFATEEIGQFLEKLRATCDARLNGTYSLLVTDAITEPEELVILRAKAKKQLTNEMFFGRSGSDYYLNVGEAPAPQPEKPSAEWKQELEHAIMSADANQVEMVMDDYLRYLQSRKAQMNEHLASAAVSRIEKIILEILEHQCKIGADELEELRFSLLLTRHMYSLEQIIHFITNQTLDVLENTAGQSRNAVPDVLKPVLQYIHENYTEALTLESMAKKFHLNASYLSRIFSKSTGQNYMSYVTNLRIEHAKKLLAGTDQVISEVAACCGFLNEPTFYATFKRCTGISPGEFRKRNRHN